MRSSLLEVRESVAALRAALLSFSPESIDSHLPALQCAGVILENLRTGSFSRTELVALSRELNGVAKLTSNGLVVCRGLLQTLRPGNASYHADGELSEAPAASTILMRG